MDPPVIPRPSLPPTGHLLAARELMSELEAAIALDIPSETFARYRRQGIGPAYTMIGRRAFYRRADLLGWLDTGGTRQAG